jgi:hypothetical protein
MIVHDGRRYVHRLDRRRTARLRSAAIMAQLRRARAHIVKPARSALAAALLKSAT